jgi:hypothetical protein
MASAPSHRAVTTDTDLIEHVVYPLDGTNTAQVDVIYNLLQRFDKSGSIYTSSTRSLGVNFWRVNISIQDAEKLKLNEYVCLQDDVFIPTSYLQPADSFRFSKP